MRKKCSALVFREQPANPQEVVLRDNLKQLSQRLSHLPGYMNSTLIASLSTFTNLCRLAVEPEDLHTIASNLFLYGRAQLRYQDVLTLTHMDEKFSRNALLKNPDVIRLLNQRNTRHFSYETLSRHANAIELARKLATLAHNEHNFSDFYAWMGLFQSLFQPYQDQHKLGQVAACTYYYCRAVLNANQVSRLFQISNELLQHSLKELLDELNFANKKTTLSPTGATIKRAKTGRRGYQDRFDAFIRSLLDQPSVEKISANNGGLIKCRGINCAVIADHISSSFKTNQPVSSKWVYRRVRLLGFDVQQLPSRRMVAEMDAQQDSIVA